jgi:hypothetical protein
LRCLNKFIGIEGANREAGQRVEEVQELNRAMLVVSPKEPSMPFGDYQGRSHERRRV